MYDESPPGAEPVVKIARLSRSYGDTLALNEVGLSVPKGVVFGLVGVNGAGKTTLIKHVLGLLRPQSGSVSVFGLDPVSDPPSVLARIGYVSVRRDILRAVIKTIADEGRTVLFSSHLLEEVERVADHVAIIHRGRVIEADGLDSLKAEFHRLVVQFESPPPEQPRADRFFGWQGGDRQWSAFFRGPAEDIEPDLARLDARLVDRAAPSLNDIFVALIGAARAREEQRI